MKALSLTQPWASLVAVGAKKYETRSWSTRYRGPLLIHAAKGFPRDAKELTVQHPFSRFLPLPHLLPRGQIIAVVRLAECRPTSERPADPETYEYTFGDYGPGRFIWELRMVYRLEHPYAVAGRLGLWEFNHRLLPEWMRIERLLGIPA